MTFMDSNNYLFPGGDYSAEPPVIAVGGTILFIVMEVTLLTKIAAHGSSIRQTYPTVASESTGSWMPGKWNT